MFNNTGKWAGEIMMRAMAEGRPMSPSLLRTCALLSRDEWELFDREVINRARKRLTAVADLYEAGLSKTIPNAFGKTLYTYEKVGDMSAAIVTLSGMDRSDDDALVFTPDSIPLPLIVKDYDISTRQLEASRNEGEPVDTMQAGVCAKLVAEKLEGMLVNGGPTFVGKSIPGYTTFTDRSTASFDSSEAWDSATKTGAEILLDVLTKKQALIDDSHAGGPYWIYIPTKYDTVLDGEYSSNYSGTIRDRILAVDGVEKVSVSDQLADGNVVMVHAVEESVLMMEGEPIQMIQWEVSGVFTVGFKVFTLQVPLIRSDDSGQSGIVHMS